MAVEIDRVEAFVAIVGLNGAARALMALLAEGSVRAGKVSAP